MEADSEIVLKGALAVRRHVYNIPALVQRPGSTTVNGEVLTTVWVTFVLLVGCLTSQQQASVSQGRICCHTETEVADQTFHLTQSQYTDTGPTSPSADPITPGATLRQKLQIQPSTSPSHSILTPGRPVPVRTL